jgi:hypothetical protein
MTRVTNQNRGLRALLALALLVVALGVPAQAAQASGELDCTPTDSQYAPPSNVLDCEQIASSGGGEAFGPLPFTGLDLISLLAIAVALTGAGLALRRLSSTESS